METVRKIAIWKMGFIATWWPILTFMWCAYWFVFIFSPLEMGDAHLRKLGNSEYIYTNVSRKPFPSELICKIDSAIVVTESNVGANRYHIDNSPGWGTGSVDWKTWPVTGKIPVGASVIVVYKILNYDCLGLFHKRVETPRRVLDVD